MQAVANTDYLRDQEAAPSTSILLVMLIAFCAFLDLYATQPLLPMLEEVFHSSKVGVGLTVSASTFAVALLAPFIGKIADAFRRKNLIMFGLLGLGATTILTATAPVLPALIGWRFLQGAFISVLYVVTMTYVNEEWAGKGVGAAMASFVTGTVLGGFFGRFLSGLVVAWQGWHWAFVLLGTLNLMGALVIWLFMPQREKQMRKGNEAGRIVSRPLLAAYLVGFNVLFSLVGTFTYVNFYLAGAPFHLNTVALAGIFTVYLVGSVVTPIAGRWIDRLGNRTIVAIAISTACFGVLLTLFHILGLVILGLALCATGVFVSQSASTSFVGLAAGKDKAFAAGIYTACYYTGGSVAGFLPGFLWPLGGWPACVTLFVTIQLVTAALALRFWRLPAKA